MKLKTTNVMSICLAACGALTIGGASAQDFVPSGNLWGYAFGDYASKAHSDTLQRGGGNVQYRGFSGGQIVPGAAGSSAALNTVGGTITPNGVGGSTTTFGTPPANTQVNGFAFRRIYLGYDYNFAPNWTAQVVLANEQNTDASNKNTMYVKYANVKWSNFIKNQDLVIGQYQTCSFATEFGTEPLWSYRSVERTIMDLHNIDGSTDLGASLQGKLWKQGGADAADSSKPNMIGYYLQVGNNNSAADNASNYKKGRLNIYGTFMHHALTVGLYGDYTVTVENSDKNKSQANTTMKAYAAFKSEWVRVGFEVFEQINKNSDVSISYTNGKVTTGALSDTVSGVQMGMSVFASSQIIKNKLSIFARYDMYNPDTKYTSGNVYSAAYGAIKPVTGQLTAAETAGATNYSWTAATFYKQSFITAGLDWTPNSRVHLMPNIWYNGYSSMVTSYTSAANVTTNYGSRVKTDNDMVYRLTFYFLFNQKKKVLNNGMSM